MELLKKLTQINAPSGNEEALREFIKSEAKNKCDEIKTDALGNLTLIKYGTAKDKKKVMLAAHMDEIGIIVKHIIGVIGCEEEKEKPTLDKLFIDVGDASKIQVGDMAVFCGEVYINGDTIISKALDNRAGCYILLKALDKLNDKNDVYLTFTVQEEVGLRGAGAAAYDIEPDFAIAVDVTDTGDTPKAPLMDVKMGKGAAVKIMDSSILCDAYLRNFMISTAKKNNIPYQAEIMADGGTDAGKIHITRSGIKTGGISVPTRYIHSPSDF